MNSPIHFGTSGWRAIIAGDFTFGNVRTAVAAIADHVRRKNPNPTLLIGYDTRFFGEEFSLAAAAVLRERGVTPLLCDAPTPTPAIAYEIRRRKLDGAINFTASHNPADYQGLKFSGADGAPAMPEVTKDIESRAKKLAEPPRVHVSADSFERVSVREPYLKRLAELVNFDSIRKAGITIVYDALHGCGAGYLDRALADHGIVAHTIRADRDVLFDGTGPDVVETNLQPLADAMCARRAQIGLATDGDADRFGIIDADGTWFQPNHILGLVYDYLITTRQWNLPSARSVATSHLLDAVARHHGTTVSKRVAVFETPVGFKYIGELIKQDKIAMGGEESAGLTIRGHVPEKDGILACLLVAEMVAARRASLGEQLKDLFRRVGREFWPLRINMHLPGDVQAHTVARLKNNFTKFLGRRVARTDRTDGLKLEFDDGSWVLMRLSGTEPLLRIYTEAATLEASRKMAEQTRAWVLAESAEKTVGRTAGGTAA
ncbi:MAG: phosphoglucomutase/phosphomannomutase family protein [Candidatus Acidiferrales bacterium]